MAKQVKDSALPPPWCGFDSWPGNFHMLQAPPPTKDTRRHHRPLTACWNTKALPFLWLQLVLEAQLSRRL